MNTELQKQLTKVRESLRCAEQFATQFEDKIPDGLGALWVVNDLVTFTVSLGWQKEDNRLRGLQAMGDIFGRDGWSAAPDSCGRKFDWKKKLACGVLLEINGAEVLPQLVPMSVHPSRFPIQLEDVK